MGLHTADAIVLRRYPFRETSVIVTCLTDQYGKLKGLVKGLRKPPNRYRSPMEPLTVNRIVFYDTRTSQLHLIGQCELLSPLEALQRDLETMRVASFCIELTDTVVPLEDPQPAVYQLLKHTLEHLAISGTDGAGVRLHFLVRLLHLVGFQPQLGECVGCRREVGAMGPGYWSAQQGGLLCASCLHQDPAGEPASVEMLSALYVLSEAAQPVKLDTRLIPSLGRRLDEFLRWRLDRALRTLTT